MIRSYTSLASMILASASLSGALHMAEGGGDGTEVLESETGFLSLAELAGANTDDVITLTSRVPTAGVWTVTGESVKLGQGEAKDNKPAPFRVTFKAKVQFGTATDPEFDNEKMVDRTLTETFTIWPTDVQEGIGLLKGRYMKAGIQNSGMPLGGMTDQGGEPGWLDNMVGMTFDVKIRHGQRNGDTVAYFDWQKTEAPEATEGDEVATA